MRSFLCILCVLAACGGSPKPAPARAEYDPELTEACVPDWGDAAPEGLCGKGEEGQWILPEDDPAHSVIYQVLALEKDHRGPSVDEAIIKLTTGVINRAGGPSCGAQVARWHRALAEVRMARAPEAFKDFGSVVKDGPNNPYYAYVGAWMKLLEPHLPAGVVMTCLVSYEGSTTAPEAQPTAGETAE